jgi:antitoxin HigA-1
MKHLLRNPHAGEILKKEFLDEIKLSQNALAKAIDVPANRIHEIVKGRRKITADTDLRLCKFFHLSNGYFLRLQMEYEIMETKNQLKIELQHITPYDNYRHALAI